MLEPEHHLELPADFDAHAWEVEAKGVLFDVVLRVAGERVTLVFYDPIRLAQDVSACVDAGRIFFEGHVVVVPRVTREAIEAAAASVAAQLAAKQ